MATAPLGAPAQSLRSAVLVRNTRRPERTVAATPCAKRRTRFPPLQTAPLFYLLVTNHFSNFGAAPLRCDLLFKNLSFASSCNEYGLVRCDSFLTRFFGLQVALLSGLPAPSPGDFEQSSLFRPRVVRLRFGSWKRTSAQRTERPNWRRSFHR
jgi:hypothetical protein